MKIKVLGSGCSNCKKLFTTTSEALKELNNNIELEYITDLEQMIKYGIMSFPALIIDEKIVSQGRVLNKEEVIRLIKNNESLKPFKGPCSCGNC